MLAIVTGASSGMGMATTAALADKGYKVIMLCRSEKRGQAAYDQLMAKEGRDIELWLCDLGSFASILQFADRFHETFGWAFGGNDGERADDEKKISDQEEVTDGKALDLLVNNAGFISLDRQETEDHFLRDSSG